MNTWSICVTMLTPKQVDCKSVIKEKPAPKPRGHTFGKTKCEYCGTEFVKRTPTGTTCSEPCRNKIRYLAQVKRRRDAKRARA